MNTWMAMAQAVASIHATLPPRDVPDLGDEAVRAYLSDAALEATLNLAEMWRLTSRQISVLLGDLPEATWFDFKAGRRASVLSQDMLTRISALVGTYKGLHLLFSDTFADEWIRRANTDATFGGVSPLEFMLRNGIEGLLATRSYVDALRGGL